MNIGANIKYLRQKNNLTQEMLADCLNVSYQAISKWETGINTPDILLLPQIAKYFNISIDVLFSDNLSERLVDLDCIKNDDVIRIVQMQGKQILDIAEVSKSNSPIEIIFPHNCNNETQYFKVEVFGNLISDSSINGDVVCHGYIQCGSINGDVQSNGDIKVSEINSYGSITCRNITNAYQIQCDSINCNGGQICAMKFDCKQYNNK